MHLTWRMKRRDERSLILLTVEDASRKRREVSAAHALILRLGGFFLCEVAYEDYRAVGLDGKPSDCIELPTDRLSVAHVSFKEVLKRIDDKNTGIEFPNRALKADIVYRQEGTAYRSHFVDVRTGVDQHLLCHAQAAGFRALVHRSDWVGQTAAIGQHLASCCAGDKIEERRGFAAAKVSMNNGNHAKRYVGVHEPARRSIQY